LEHTELGNEARGEGKAAHPQQQHRERHRQHRLPATETSERGDRSRTACRTGDDRHDTKGTHELQGVDREIEPYFRRADAAAHHPCEDESGVGDSRIGEQPPHIVLHERQDPTHHHRQGGDTRNERRPLGEQRRERSVQNPDQRREPTDLGGGSHVPDDAGRGSLVDVRSP
jgi:hypothetical protein